MTDKEKIIIDGVDVSGCLFYQSNFEEDYDVKIKHFCSNWHNSCESVNNSNCYFKQLQRKVQECEKYKQTLEEILSIATNSDMLPCADFEVDCTKCKDRITEKGKRCMRYGLIKIKNVVEKAKDNNNG